ncbi:MAG: hypothetical protein LBD07_02270, partial [Spirochaetaceae bacterium]|nr:hypothetical protein [Spirochaetaceae bacterium]
APTGVTIPIRRFSVLFSAMCYPLFYNIINCILFSIVVFFRPAVLLSAVMDVQRYLFSSLIV